MVSAKHPSISIEGEYTGAWNKIAVRCMECGHEWEPAANSLLQGHGCPSCAAVNRGTRKRKTNQEFIDEMSLINPMVSICSTYSISNSSVLCKCRQCGNKWEALPSNLLKGKGCPSCASKKNGINKRMKPEKYEERLQKKNPNIELLSRYEKSNSKVRCHCKICDNYWQANPLDLLAGRGCPKCSYATRAKQKQKPVILIETGQRFESIKMAAEYVGTTDGNISACLKGKTKTAKGMHWKFADLE